MIDWLSGCFVGKCGISTVQGAEKLMHDGLIRGCAQAHNHNVVYHESSQP